MNTVIEELNQALYALTDKKALSPDDLKFLEQCLHHKWYGVQVVAAKVLSKFHPPEALPLLKNLLTRHPTNRQMSAVAQKALLPCLRETDMSWVFELYLRDRANYYLFLIGALMQFPDQDIIRCLIIDCQQKDNVVSITVLAAVSVTSREIILKKLMQNPNISHKAYLERAFGWNPIREDQLLKFNRPL